MDIDNSIGKKNINFEMRTNMRLLQIPYTAHVTHYESRSRIGEWIGETDNLLKIVQSRTLKWFDVSIII